MNTRGFGGRKLRKTIKVETNDPKRQNFNLVVTGAVEKFATISPSRVRLTGALGQPIRTAVNIIPEKAYPFRILKTDAREGKYIRFDLKEVKHDKGLGYLLTVENLKKEPGRYFDTINLETDSTIQPKIFVRVYGNIYDPKQARKTP